MKLFLTILILSLISITIFKLKSNRDLQRKSKSKLRFIDWMQLTNEQRREIDFIDKRETMKRKKILLSSIREEYKKLKNK